MHVTQGRRGQALVEFALVLPILMLIFLGIVQFGLLLSSQIGMISGVRDAIRYGETVQTDALNAGGDCASGGHADCIRQKLVSSILPGSMAAFSAANLDTMSADQASSARMPDSLRGVPS